MISVLDLFLLFSFSSLDKHLVSIDHAPFAGIERLKAHENFSLLSGAYSRVRTWAPRHLLREETGSLAAYCTVQANGQVTALETIRGQSQFFKGAAAVLAWTP